MFPMVEVEDATVGMVVVELEGSLVSLVVVEGSVASVEVIEGCIY